MIVQFVEAHTLRPIGLAFRVCELHRNTQTVPENRILKMVDKKDGGCDECRAKKYRPPGKR